MFSAESNSFFTGISLFFGGALVSIGYLIIVLRERHKFLEKLGIKGPKPKFLLGNMMEVLQDQIESQSRYVKEYGRIYGLYFAYRPRIMITDPEVLIQICIKDFDAFPNHEVHDLMNKYHKKFLITLQDDEWRRVRSIMSPTFTTGKMRKMFRVFDDSSTELVEIFNCYLRNNGKELKSALVQVRDCYQLYSLDIMTTCCFGLKLKTNASAGDINSMTRDQMAKLLDGFFSLSKFRHFLREFVPTPWLKFFGFKTEPDSKFEEVLNLAKGIITARRKTSKRVDDFLQTILDARLSEQITQDLSEDASHGWADEYYQEDKNKDFAKNENINRGLNDLEIISQTMLFLLVGKDNVANLLSTATYNLAFHPEVQERLKQEIESIAKYDDNGKLTFSFDDVMSCQYLDAVLSETLRMTPVITFVERVASRDYHLEKYNCMIPKGTLCQFAYYTIHHDPEFWTQPEVFDPERFMPGNKEKIIPGSFVPFGSGPRHCLGMRFVLSEVKLALAKVLMNFTFSPAPGFQFPGEYEKSFGLLYLKNPTVTIQKRA